jgi:cyanophycin synthetase
MEIIKTNVIHGPNYWSVMHNQLIAVKFDPEFEKSFTASEKTIERKLKAQLPSYKNKESLKFSHISEETVPALIVQITAELQELAGMKCEFKKSYSIPNGLYCLVFSYEIEEAGLYAFRAAVRLIRAVMSEEVYDLSVDINRLNRIKYRGLGPTTSFLLDEVKKRKIPFKRFEGGSLVTLGYGCKQKKMRTAVTDNTSALGLEIAGDKEETKLILSEAHAPVPKGLLIYDEEELRESINSVRFPLVIKPINGNHGRGVTTNINSLEEAIFGFRIAKQISDTVIVEEFVTGHDFRFLIVNFKFVAVAMRTPAMITGNGRSTIEELIDEENSNPERGDGPEHTLALIRVDEITQKILNASKLTLDSVLPEGKILYLKDTANISMGGTSTDLTDIVHPYNKFLAERVARLFNLDICGLDVIASRVDVPLTRDVGAIIEVNAGPGLRMHSNPNTGIGRNVAKPIMEMLFPDPDSALIPVIAVTGREDAAIITKLIAQMATKSGRKTGYATYKGVFIKDFQLADNDGTYFENGRAVLFDPTINFSVLQCEAEEILAVGLPFNECDISIISNIDHHSSTSVKGIISDTMINIQKVVAHTTKADGYAILNAEDEKVYELLKELKCRVALFSLKNSTRIKEHCANGGIAVVVEDDQIIVYDGTWKTRIEKVSDIQINLNGKTVHMVNVLLPAVLAAFIQGFRPEVIAGVLRSHFKGRTKVKTKKKKTVKR